MHKPHAASSASEPQAWTLRVCDDPGEIDAKAADRGMRQAAPQSSVLDLNDLAASTNDDFAEFLEPLDILRPQRRELHHLVCLAFRLDQTSAKPE